MAARHEQPTVHPAPGQLPSSPWVLVDDLTIEQCADVLERLTTWLGTGDREHTDAFADVFSHGDTDPAGIASWTQALAARLRRCAQGGEL